MTETVRQYALADSPEEAGAAEHRFRVEYIDPTKGTATGYVAKYISKNVDGYGMAPSEGVVTPNSSAHRVRAWASTWGIRQFQQVGGPPVSLWREFRRAPELANSGTLIGQLAIAADQSNWQEFTKLLGGAQSARKTLPVKIEKYMDTRPGRYGELLGLRVAGVRMGNVVFSTRFHNWSIRRKDPAQNCTRELHAVVTDSVLRIEETKSLGLAPPWSSVNNCTELGASIRDYRNKAD
jgi:hypothetical protein